MSWFSREREKDSGLVRKPDMRINQHGLSDLSAEECVSLLIQWALDTDQKNIAQRLMFLRTQREFHERRYNEMCEKKTHLGDQLDEIRQLNPWIKKLTIES